MSAEKIKAYKEYYEPRTHQECVVLDKQVKQKMNMMSFFGLAAGAFALAPVAGPTILGVATVGAGVYWTCKVLENHKLATENLNLFHAFKKENSVHTSHYKALTQVAEVINNEKSTIGSILSSIRNLRKVEVSQENALKLKQ